MSNSRSIVWCVTLLVAAFAGLACAEVAEIQLTDDASVYAVVIGSTDAHSNEELAIRELCEHFLKISGRELPVVRVEPDGFMAEISKAKDGRKVPIVIGQAAMTEVMTAAIQEKGTDPASFAIFVEDGIVRIAGLSPQGTLFGTYDVLEQFGCRWFTPGEFGTVIPSSRVVSIGEQRNVQVPSFAGRALQMTENQTDWYRRMRLGGEPVPGAHGIDIGDANIQKNPELYALFNGERYDAQLCITNPEVLRRAIHQARLLLKEHPGSIIGMGPGDGRGFCECQACVALDAGDWDPFAKMISVTDRYVWFFNQVLEALEAEFPAVQITFYAYDGTMRPPVKVKANPRIIPTFALIRVCHLHGMANPVCPERDYYQTLLSQWSSLVTQSFDRDYLLNYSGFPVSHVHRSRSELPILKKNGITRIRRQTWPCWGNMTPGIYITAKLLWNADADVDALEKDFYEKFFGPAAEPMGRYFDRLEAAYHDADTHPRWENVDMIKVLPAEARQSCKQDIEEARSLAGEGIFASRVAAFSLMHESLDVYLTTIAAQERFDFAAARDGALRLAEIQSEAMRHDPPLLFEPTTMGLQQTIEDAYAKTTGDNRLLAGIDPQWNFLIDPVQIGEDLKYSSKHLQGGNWDRRSTTSVAIKAVVSDWDQDLRWYSGDAWYRTTVRIPSPDADASKLMLWFRRMPEGSRVWLNGRLVGECGSSAGRITPYEVDITDAAVLDGENVIAIKATGPVFGPTMVYSTPAAPVP